MHNVTLTLEEIGPDEHRGRHPERFDRSEYERSHYLATLTYERRSARYRFTTGAAWDRPPVAREVLESVLSDSTLLDEAETLADARDALRDNLGEDAGNVDELARALLASDKKTRRLLGDEYAAAIADPSGWTWAHTPEPPEWISRNRRPVAGSSYSGAIGRTKQGEPVRISIELSAGKNGPELSISGSTPYSGGQIRGTLDELETYAAPWTAETVAELARIWDAWHLNGMRSRCAHQHGPEWDTSRELTLYHWRRTEETEKRIRDAEKTATEQLRAGATVSLPADVLELAAHPREVTTFTEEPPAPIYEPRTDRFGSGRGATETKTAGWVRPTEHPDGLLTKPCPTCGYGYGTAWLYEPLPADVLEWLAEHVGIRPPVLTAA